jgi:hypothetical protein
MLIVSSTIFGVTGAFLRSETLLTLAGAAMGAVVGAIKPWEYVAGRRPSGEHPTIEERKR